MKNNCWFSDKARHSAAAKKGWKTRKAAKTATVSVPRLEKSKPGVKVSGVKKKAIGIKKRMVDSFVKAWIDHDKLHVKIPHYYPGLVTAAKNMGGKWDDKESVWLFDPRIAGKVESKYRDIFGMWTEPFEAADIILDVGQKNLGQAYYIAGRLVAERRYRDSRVKLGDGVIVLDGSFPSSGGSVKDPCIHQSDDMRIEMLDVPREVANGLARHDYISIDTALKSNPVRRHLPMTTSQIRTMYKEARKRFGKENVHSIHDAIRLFSLL